MLYDDTHLYTFRTYVALKLHFNEQSTYVYTENSLNRLTVETMLKRKDLGFFVELSKMYNGNTVKIFNHILTCFLDNADMWVGDMLTRKYQKKCEERLDIVSNVKNHLVDFFDTVEMLSSDDWFTCKKNDRPDVIKYSSGTKDEVFAIIESIRPFTHQETCNPLWHARKNRIRAYSKLITVSDDVKSLCVEKLKTLDTAA